MPDITMCKNKKCPLRHSCERSESSGTVPKPKWQSFSFYEPVFVGQDDHDDNIDGYVCKKYVEKRK